MEAQEQEQYGINAQETSNKDSSKKLVEREEVEGTPFTMIRTDETGWFLTMGKHRLSNPYETKEELLEWVISGNKTGVNWQLLMAVTAVILKEYKNLEA